MVDQRIIRKYMTTQYLPPVCLAHRDLLVAETRLVAIEHAPKPRYCPGRKGTGVHCGITNHRQLGNQALG